MKIADHRRVASLAARVVGADEAEASRGAAAPDIYAMKYGMRFRHHSRHPRLITNLLLEARREFLSGDRKRASRLTGVATHFALDAMVDARRHDWYENEVHEALIAMPSARAEELAARGARWGLRHASLKGARRLASIGRIKDPRAAAERSLEWSGAAFAMVFYDGEPKRGSKIPFVATALATAATVALGHPYLGLAMIPLNLIALYDAARPDPWFLRP